MRSHAAGIAPASAASLVLALMLLPALHPSSPTRRLLAWLAALAVVMALRLWLRHAHRRAAAPATAPWLTRFRAAFLLHGLVWGAMARLPSSVVDPDVQAPLILVLGGVAAAALTLTLYDLQAALPFAVPALLPLALRLLDAGVPLSTPSLAATLMLAALLAAFSFAARRVQRERLALAAARQAEAEGAADARRAEGLLHLIFDHIGEGISVFDRDLRLAAWNKHYAEFVGLDPALVRLGTPLIACLLNLAQAGEYGPLDDIEGEVQRRTAQLLEPQPGVTHRLRPDGREVEIRRSPMPGGGFIVVYVDVTQRRASEAALFEQQRMLSVLLRNTEQGFWFIDNDLRTTDANPAMCRMLAADAKTCWAARSTSSSMRPTKRSSATMWRCALPASPAATRSRSSAATARWSTATTTRHRSSTLPGARSARSACSPTSASKSAPRRRSATPVSCWRRSRMCWRSRSRACRRVC